MSARVVCRVARAHCKICREYDLAIIEDDPYFYLQHHADQPDDHEEDPPNPDQPDGHKGDSPNQPDRGVLGLASEGNPGPGSDGSSPAASSLRVRLGPSFLSLDVDGRVLRLDSFSKVFPSTPLVFSLPSLSPSLSLSSRTPKLPVVQLWQ